MLKMLKNVILTKLLLKLIKKNMHYDLLKKELSENVSNKAVPIWFMRQAGRYMKEYMHIRQKNSFLDMCLDSEIIRKITLQPIHKFDLDAAIIFSDILILPFALGLELEFKKDVGPVFIKDDVEKRVNTILSRKLNSTITNFIFEGIRKVKKDLSLSYAGKSLIGFAGSPFTVACYIISGKGSKNFDNVRKYLYENKEKFQKLIDALTDETIIYLRGQAENGADILKLFDSWAGILAEEEFKKYVVEPNKRIIREIKAWKKNTSFICFPRGIGEKYKYFVENVATDVISIDHTISNIWARDNLQKKVVVQGNLDNAILTARGADIKKEVNKILSIFSSGKFVFNLRHGILPNTPICNIEEVIKTVRNYDR